MRIWDVQLSDDCDVPFEGFYVTAPNIREALAKAEHEAKKEKELKLVVTMVKFHAETR